MADWNWAPQYRLYCKTQGEVWSLKTLVSAQALLTTGQGVNQATFVLADPDGFIRKQAQPKPMSLVQLWSTNRAGEGGVVWTGYIDEAHKAFDPDQGDHVTLACSGPVKLFEITRQSPGDAAGLAIAYARNVAASSVLQFAARACGYPSRLLNIHPLADSGSGLQQLGAGAFTQPDQQQWSAVVAALQGNSGIEWFFDARGACFWRQLNFLDPWFPPGAGRPAQRKPRTIAQEDILHADFAQSDAGIVTDVQVRWGLVGFVQNAANWPPPGKESSAHKSMVAHLRTRRLVVYAPWLLNKQAAQYLAQVLYEQYAAGVAQASVTIPADPLIEIGSLVDVPALGTGGKGVTRYYVTSISAQLQWGGAWVYTLGLAYGHAPEQSFPYVGGVAFPALTKQVAQSAPKTAQIASYSPSNPFYDETPYSIVAQSSLPIDEAAVSSRVYPVGSVIWIWSKPHSTGGLVGPAPLGEYTVVGPSDAAQADTTIAIKSTKSAVGYVTVKSWGPAPLSETAGANALNGASYNTTLSGTGSSGADEPADPGAQPEGPASALALRALQAALTRAHMPFDLNHAGDDAWDCSGLVAWSYAQVGIGVGQLFFASPGNGHPWNTDGGPIGVWRFMQTIGAVETAVDAAQKGDLLFCQDDDGSFSHVCFRWDSAKLLNYGANWYPNRIGVLPDKGFISDGGSPINKALSLSALAQAGQRAKSVQEQVQSAADKAFGPGQGDALWQIVLAESSGDPTAVNQSSLAAGLFQRLPCPVPSAIVRNSGGTLVVDLSVWPLAAQIADGVNYVSTRYGNATKALAFRQANSYY